MDTEVETYEDIDVDIEKEVICESVLGCDNKAEWLTKYRCSICGNVRRLLCNICVERIKFGLAAETPFYHPPCGIFSRVTYTNFIKI